MICPHVRWMAPLSSRNQRSAARPAITPLSHHLRTVYVFTLLIITTVSCRATALHKKISHEIQARFLDRRDREGSLTCRKK